jgi:hypothetical protein
MSLFDLFFIVCFFVAVILVLRSVYCACRRRWSASARALALLGIGALVYGSVLVGVGFASRPNYLPMGTKQCFDDWCVSVERAAQQPTIGAGPESAQASGVFRLVTVKVTSQARRVAQRAADVEVCLIDSRGQRYAPSPIGQRALDLAAGSGPELSSMVEPGASFERTVVFDLPTDASDVGLIVTHGRFPSVLIIGDTQSFCHAPTILRLEPAPPANGS